MLLCAEGSLKKDSHSQLQSLTLRIRYGLSVRRQTSPLIVFGSNLTPGAAVSCAAGCKECRRGLGDSLNRSLTLSIVMTGVDKLVCFSELPSEQHLSIPQSATLGFRTCWYCCLLRSSSHMRPCNDTSECLLISRLQISRPIKDHYFYSVVTHNAHISSQQSLKSGGGWVLLCAT